MRVLYGVVVTLLWAAPAAAVDQSGNAGAVSDYRYRGVSLSHGRAAVQGELTVEHKSGLYADLWGSSLGRGSEFELDLTGGYEVELSEQIGIDLSATWYAYPAGGDENYLEATAAATLSHGPASARLGFSYAPRQHGTRDEDGRGHANTYAFVEGTYDMPKTLVSLTAGLGYERGWFDEVERGGKWDWKLGAEMALKPAKLGLAYVGSNADGGDRHALVASAFLSW